MFLAFLAGGPGLPLANALPGQAGPEQAPGLAAVFASQSHSEPQERTDHTAAPGIQLFVREEQSPTPFLPPGPFRVEWTGFVSVDLRSDMFFQAEASGTFHLEVNGRRVLSHRGTGQASELTGPIRLHKGTNSIAASLTSPAEGDTWVRLHWGEDETLLGPIPVEALSLPSSNAAMRESTLRREGRGLALEHRCFHCHAVDGKSAVPELSMDAPAFTGMGARRRFAWMTAWIRDPRSLRETATMPALLHGPQSGESARAIAAFLATLREDSQVEPSRDDGAADGRAAYALERARALGRPVADNWYERLHCEACHGGLGEESPGSISLRRVDEKYPAGALEAFLRKPDRHYAWIRMPDFQLTGREAAALAKALRAAGAPWTETPPLREPSSMVERGRELVQTTGCLNCHELPLENRFRTTRWSELKNWNEGCLSAEPRHGSPAPVFKFSADERNALAVFARTGGGSLRRHVPWEFAGRQTRLLRCVSCHGPYEGFPAWEGLGGKLKPAWMEALLAGGLPVKPRPWLPARMPAFASRAKLLAEGLAAQHGFPFATPQEPPIDRELAVLGQKLVGKSGGFSCVSCHAVGTRQATEVFEAEGINLAQVADRLRNSYYHRWMQNPTAIDPQTKMPVYFDQGYSPLADVLDGEAERQIEAMWEYFRMREAMPAPSVEGF